KGAKPAILATNEVAWTTEYAAAPPDAKPSRWRNPQIIGGLDAETYGKCAYCEAIIGDVSFPNVEHLFPKSARPDLVVNWESLTCACPPCNTSKSTYYEPTAPLIHPYDDDPGAALEFRGPAVFASLGNDMGARTVARLKLMRPALLLERTKRLQS